MRKSAKIITALSVAGLAVAAGSAFTGTGVAATGQASAAQFVGGTVSQSVSGATLTEIAYSFADAGANTRVNSIALTFSTTADGRAVAVTPTGGSGGTFDCTDVLSNASTCTFIPTDAETGYTGLSSLAVTVSE
ncbi:spermidine/putrescine-binding protein [Arthrobacter sp. 2762]